MSAHDWPRAQALSLYTPALSLLVDLSKTGLADDALRKHPLVTGAFPGAFLAMDALEKGAIANPDEKRMVGHYWLRAPERAPDASIADAIRGALARIEDFAASVHGARIAPPRAPRFTNLLVVGIGGSALGPQFVADALGSPRDPLHPFFFDNTDPDGLARELSRIAATEGGLPATLTVVISKSGETKETRNGMLVAGDAYHRAGLDFTKHAVAVTGAHSELDEVAARSGWLERFPMWDWVGGRTSELSAVGLLPAALQGLDIQAMLSGAAACDAATRVHEVAQNPAAMLALAWHAETGGRGAKDMVVLPYKDRLLLFPRYLQQLVMESLGKEKDLEGRVVNQGIAVYGNKGSTDQHAYVQQLREGVPNFFATFLEVEKDREDGARSYEVEPDVTPGDYLHGFLLGTRRALHENGRGSITLTVPDVSARTVGFLIALYERAVGLYAQLVGINAYHQPGVEAGKKAAAAVLALQGRVLAELRAKPGELRTAEKVASAMSEGDVETVFAVLRHLAANPDHGISRKDGPTFFLATFGVR